MGDVACLLSVALLSAGCAAPRVMAEQAEPRSPSTAALLKPLELGYTLTLHTDEGRPTRLEVRVCFPGLIPKVLIPGLPRAGRYLLEPPRTTGGLPLSFDRDTGAVALGGVSAGDCVRLVVSLARLAASEPGGTTTMVTRTSLTTTAGLWLWRPQHVTAQMTATARFVLPAGAEIAAPWPRNDEGDYVLDISAFQRPSRVVLGTFTSLTVPAEGGQAQLNVAILDGPRRATDAGVLRWLEAAALTQRQVFRGFSVDAVQVVVAPVAARGREPVLFGMALRGGGAAVVLLLDSQAEDDALPGEWIAVHELFHVGMPPVVGRDAWLFEGVTQYYTEVLRGRAGFLSPLEAWDRLVQGFSRGRHGGSGRTLASESLAMHQTGAYQRVYWGGAAIALQWDVALRQASGGAKSLDDAMEALRVCCARDRKEWTAEELLVWFDAWWGGEPLFSAIASEDLASTEFPELTETWQRLGLSVRQGRVRFAPLARPALHDRILSPKPQDQEARGSDPVRTQ
jgi:hypothetical protein